MQKLCAKIALSIFVSIYSQFLYVLELKKTENKAKIKRNLKTRPFSAVSK